MPPSPPAPASISGGLTIFYDPGIGGIGNLGIKESFCVYDDNIEERVVGGKCYAFDSDSQQPDCFGKVGGRAVKCIPQDGFSTLPGNGIATILAQAINSYYINPEALAQIKLVPLSGAAGTTLGADIEKLATESSHYNLVFLTSTSSTNYCSITDGSGFYRSSFSGASKKYCRVFGGAPLYNSFGNEPESLVQSIAYYFAGSRNFTIYSTGDTPSISSPIGYYGQASMQTIASGLRTALENIIN